MLSFYAAARTRVRPERLLATLQELDYVYPYHQAIGFYMTEAGYDEMHLDGFKQVRMNYDFYLSHGLEDPAYNAEWRIYVPRNLGKMERMLDDASPGDFGGEEFGD